MYNRTMKHALGIIVKNRINFTIQTLNALRSCKQKGYDLFVINNNSDKSDSKLLEQALQDMKVKEFKTFNEDQSISVAWNYFLYQTKKYSFRTKLDNDIVVPNKKFLDDMAISDSSLNAVIPLNKPLKFNSVFYQEYASLPYLYGACMQIPKKLFKRLGYFNEKMPRMIDIEYSKRALRCGFKLRYLKDYSAQHLGTGRNNTTEQNWDIVVEKARIAKKNFYCKIPATSRWEIKKGA